MARKKGNRTYPTSEHCARALSIASSYFSRCRDDGVLSVYEYKLIEKRINTLMSVLMYSILAK